jgi:two-component system, NtrC family, sensor kinase
MTPETNSVVPAGQSEVERLRAELDAMHRKLAEAHRMASLGRLSAGIVHEINTPVGSILSNNEVILRSLDRIKTLLSQAQTSGGPPPPKAMEILDVVAGLANVDKLACERISGIVRSLKTFARVSDHDRRKVEVNELVHHTLKLSNAVYRRRIAFVADLAELPLVECFPALLSQVLLNLVVNAAQAIDGEGTVTVRTRVEGPQVHIAVADTGQGIQPEDHGKIFRAGFTTKPIGEGTGIGLALSREIVVDTHGGSIDFESEPGKGTVFDVRIPIAHKRNEQ